MSAPITPDDPNGVCTCDDIHSKKCPKHGQKHSAMCHEYWERGLECRCVPDWVNDAIRAGAKPEDVM